MGVENTSGTDTRAENAEQPPSQDDPPGPPPDRPGSPGQPSRLESLRAAREAQEARRAETQQTNAREIDTEQGSEPEKEESEPSSAEGADAEAEPKDAEATQETGRSGPESDERETGRPDIGEARPDGLGEQPPAAETGALTSETSTERREEDKNDKAEPSSPDATTERPEEPTDPHTVQGYGEVGETQPDAGETGQSDGHGEEPRVQEIPENSSDPPDEHGPPEPRDADADDPEERDHPPLARQGDQSRAQDTGETTPEPPDERDQPQQTREQDTENPQNQDHRPLPQQDAQASDTDDSGTGREPAIERTAPAEDEPTDHEHAPPDEPAPTRAEQRDGDTEIGPPTEGDQQGTPEDQARLAETPQRTDAPVHQVTPPPAAEEGAARWTSAVIRFNDRTPGPQVEPRDRNAEGRPETPANTEDDKKYDNLPDRSQEGTPGRGDAITPEDDPANRDYLEPDPDTIRRRDRFGRRFARSTPDTADAGKKWTDHIGKFLGDQPRGPMKPSTTKDIPNDPVAPHQKMTAGNGLIGVALVATLFVRGALRARSAAADKLTQSRGRRDGDNG